MINIGLNPPQKNHIWITINSNHVFITITSYYEKTSVNILQICNEFHPSAMVEENWIHQVFAVQMVVELSSNLAQNISI